MGDIFRKVSICGLTNDGDQLNCVETEALIDSGASSTLISADLAERLGGSVIKGMDTNIEGRSIPRKLTGVRLVAPGCDVEALAVAVDNALIKRAGAGSDGKPVHVIVGHDYLQRRYARLAFGPSQEDHTVACEAPPPIRRARGKK